MVNSMEIERKAKSEIVSWFRRTGRSTSLSQDDISAIAVAIARSFELYDAQNKADD